MRNLKKVLALCVALTMAFGLMISASAFTDDASIKNTDAVELLTQLQIINGFPDGSFQPTGLVTRAQMAKMIYVALRGGKDDGAVSFKNASVPLSDISGHWAAGYIKFMYANNTVAGFPDGTFKPDVSVTGYQAAKMLLTVLGYSSDIEGYTGTGWDFRVAVDAATAGLLDGLEDIDLSLPLSRDNAAQMIYNMIFANMVTYSDGISNEEDYTFAGKKLGLEEITGILMKTDTIGFDGASDDGECVLDTDVDSSFVLDCDADAALLGQEVTVYVKASDSDKNGDIEDDEVTKVYGKVVATGNNYVLTKYTAAFSDGTSDYDLVAGTEYSYNYEALGAVGASPVQGDKTVYIDNNDDGDWEIVITLDLTFGEVDVRSSGTMTLPGLFTKEDIDDVVGGADLDDGDYAIGYEIDGTYYVELVASFDGAISGQKTTKIAIDGTYYSASAISGVDTDLMTNMQDLADDTDVTVYTYGGYIVAYDTADEEDTPALYCGIRGAQGYAEGNALGSGGQTAKVAVTLQDGTEKIYAVDSVDDYDWNNDGDHTGDATEADLSDDAINWKTGADDYLAEYVGAVFEYSLTDDGLIVLEKRIASDDALADITSDYASGGKFLKTLAGTYYVDSSTVFFDWDVANKDFDVHTGRSGSPVYDADDAGDTAAIYDAGDYTAATATVVLSTGAGDVVNEGNFGIVMSYSIKTESDGDKYYKITLFDGSDFVTYNTVAKASTTLLQSTFCPQSDLVLGAVITFTLDDDVIQATGFDLEDIYAPGNEPGGGDDDYFALGFALEYVEGDYIYMRSDGDSYTAETYTIDDATVASIDADNLEVVFDDVDPTDLYDSDEIADSLDSDENGNTILQISDGEVVGIYYFPGELFDIVAVNPAP